MTLSSYYFPPPCKQGTGVHLALLTSGEGLSGCWLGGGLTPVSAAPAPYYPCIYVSMAVFLFFFFPSHFYWDLTGVSAVKFTVKMKCCSQQISWFLYWITAAVLYKFLNKQIISLIFNLGWSLKLSVYYFCIKSPSDVRYGALQPPDIFCRKSFRYKKASEEAGWEISWDILIQVKWIRRPPHSTEMKI